MASRRTRRGSSYAGQNSSVCCAVSFSLSEWWHVLVTSRRILNRNSPNAPFPVSTCVILYVSGSPPWSLQAPQLSRTAPTARWDRTISSVMSWLRHRSQVSSLASPRCRGSIGRQRAYPRPSTGPAVDGAPVGALGPGARTEEAPPEQSPTHISSVISLQSWWRSFYEASSTRVDFSSDPLPTPEPRTGPENGWLLHTVNELRLLPHRYSAAAHIWRWLSSSLWEPGAWSVARTSIDCRWWGPNISSAVLPQPSPRLYPDIGRAEESFYVGSHETIWPSTRLGTSSGPAVV